MKVDTNTKSGLLTMDELPEEKKKRRIQILYLPLTRKICPTWNSTIRNRTAIGKIEKTKFWTKNQMWTKQETQQKFRQYESGSQSTKKVDSKDIVQNEDSLKEHSEDGSPLSETMSQRNIWK